MELAFAKITGAGNDFVALDNLDGSLHVDLGDLARALCDRHFGIGADGILVLERSAVADFRMVYYNADGSSGGMCGNGGRCAARFARALGMNRETLRFEALDFVYTATFSGQTIQLRMKDPSRIQRGIRVRINESPRSVHAIDTGSPHVVLFVDDLEAVDVSREGQMLRAHERFAPTGTNVNFVQLLDTDTIAIRTYERGVEAETLACGTGSIASAVIAHLEMGLRPPIRVRARSGESLRVSFAGRDEFITNVVLEGGADIVFTGITDYDADKVKTAVLQWRGYCSRA